MKCISIEKYYGYFFVVVSEMVVFMRDKCYEEIVKIKDIIILNCCLVV